MGAAPEHYLVQQAIGILCVHGIGSQKRGETLSQFVDPIVEDLRRSAGADDWDRVVESHAVLRAGERQPPHCVVDFCRTGTSPGRDKDGLRIEPDPERVVSRCLFAESQWGDSFTPPSVNEMAPWLLTRGVWVAIRHFSMAFFTPRLPTASRILGALVGVPIAFVMQIGTLALWLAAMIPIPGWAKLLSRLSFAITGALGDSLVLGSPTKQGQILSAVRDDLEWLRSRGCQQIVVLAHSQGAALAVYSLRTEPADSIDLLVTFGSGLAKLEEIRLVNSGGGPGPGSFLMLGMAVPLAVLGLAVVFLAPVIDTWALMGVLSLVAVTVVTLYSWFARPSLTSEAVLDLFRRYPPSEASAFRCWFDYYATKDPVPQGAIPAERIPEGRFRSREVHNSASILGDHTGYWRNRDEFVPLIVDALYPVVFSGLHPNLPRRQRDADERTDNRKVRVGWLFASRAAILFTLLGAFSMFGYARREAAAQAGSNLRSLLNAEWGSPSLSQLQAAMRPFDSNDLRLLSGIVLLLLAGRLLSEFSWRIWDHHSVDRIYEDQFLEFGPLWRWSAFLTLLLASFGSCWLALSVLATGRSPLLGATQGVALLLGTVGYLFVLVPPLALALALAFGILLLKAWRKAR